MSPTVPLRTQRTKPAVTIRLGDDQRENQPEDLEPISQKRALEDPRENPWFMSDDEPGVPVCPTSPILAISPRLYARCSPLAAAIEAPGGSPLVRQVRLFFLVSRDEEYVELRASVAGQEFDVGARGHNYLLLTLARRRLKDAAEGLSDAACGWTCQQDLAHDPTMTPPQLNVDVFRIRKKFVAIGLFDAAHIVERRTRLRQLRIGTGHLSIARL